MANPITILIEQAGQPAGTAGVSRDNLVTGSLVTCTDPANIAGGGTWSWTLVVPNGSSTSGSGAATTTFTFTPDVPGTYLVYLVYDDGTAVQSWTVDAVGQKITTQGGAGVKGAHQLRPIGFGETTQFGSRGWDPAAEAASQVAASLPVFIYRPGGVAKGNVYTDLSLLCTSAAFLGGNKILVFDDSISAITIPSGAYAMDGLQWVGIAPWGDTVVNIGQGATFTGLRRFRNLRVNNQSTVSPCTDLANGETVEGLEFATLHCPSGKAPFYTLSAMSAGNWGLFLFVDSSLGGNNSDPVVHLPDDINADIELYGVASLAENAVSGTASSTMEIYPSGTAAYWMQSQPGFLGSLDVDTQQAQTLAPNPAYGVAASTSSVTIRLGEYVRLDATSGQISQPLPSVTGVGPTGSRSTMGMEIRIKEFSGVNGVLVTPYSGDTVNKGASLLIPAGHSATFVSDGISDWGLTAITSASGTDANAIHDNVAAEISAVTEKASPVSADLVLIEDSADSNNKKRVQIGNLPGGTDADAIHNNVAAEINVITAKSPLVAADQLLIEDSADSNAKKKALVSALRITESQVTDLSHTDAAAIHGNVAAEISAITEKGVPVSADLLVIEDSADSNNKKRVQIGSLPGGGAADALSTTGADVDVSAAAPPTVGQVLKADDATHATWQDESAASGTVQGDLLSMSLSADWDSGDIGANAPFPFDTVGVNRGDLTLDTVTNIGRVSGLKAGRTYRLEAMATQTANAIILYGWWDVINGAWLGNQAVNASPANAFVRGNAALAAHTFTPATDLAVELRISGISATTDIDSIDPTTSTPLTWAAITEIGGSALLSTVNQWEKSQVVKTKDLGNISGATAIDADDSNTYKAVATAAAEIGAPSNLVDGWTVVLRIRQGGVGSFAVTFNAVWDWGDDGAPDTSADAAGTLLLVSGSSDGTNIFASWKKGYTNT